MKLSLYEMNVNDFRRNYSLIAFNSINADKSVINNNYGRRLTKFKIYKLNNSNKKFKNLEI